jgi:hypothetical protein
VRKRTKRGVVWCKKVVQGMVIVWCAISEQYILSIITNTDAKKVWKYVYSLSEFPLHFVLKTTTPPNRLTELSSEYSSERSSEPSLEFFLTLKNKSNFSLLVIVRSKIDSGRRSGNRVTVTFRPSGKSLSPFKPKNCR